VRDLFFGFSFDQVVEDLFFGSDDIVLCLREDGIREHLQHLLRIRIEQIVFLSLIR
jgi:hypothetical protein